MTTPSLSPSSLPRGLTYARARLFLGVSGVGSAVLLTAALLYVRVPSRGLSSSAAEPLARALFKIDIDANIPLEHYRAVAEIIGYVMRLKGKLPRKLN